jgi:hypothetical protein
MVHTGRGTGSRKLKDIPEPTSRPSTEGKTRNISTTQIQKPKKKKKKKKRKK